MTMTVEMLMEKVNQDERYQKAMKGILKAAVETDTELTDEGWKLLKEKVALKIVHSTPEYMDMLSEMVWTGIRENAEGEIER